MQLLLIHYPKCSTCQKARRWLEAHSIPFESRHIAEDPPTRQELAHWAQHLPLKRL
jgi:arsenate reductase